MSWMTIIEYIVVCLWAIAAALAGWRYYDMHQVLQASHRTQKQQNKVIENMDQTMRRLHRENSQLRTFTFPPPNQKAATPMRDLGMPPYYYPPAITPARFTRDQIVAELLVKETDALERAKGALWRLNAAMVRGISAKAETGGGPIFSADKQKVATKALGLAMEQLDSDDWFTVAQWLKDHPGRIDELVG